VGQETVHVVEIHVAQEAPEESESQRDNVETKKEEIGDDVDLAFDPVCNEDSVISPESVSENDLPEAPRAAEHSHTHEQSPEHDAVHMITSTSSGTMP
jgi:hypothetical protein